MGRQVLHSDRVQLGAWFSTLMAGSAWLCMWNCARRYGGVAYREAVAQAADWYTFRVADITDTLTAALRQ